MRWLSAILAVTIAMPFCPGASGQTEGPKLNLVIVEGDGGINNIRQRTAREPIVQVEDENHKPVAGAVVVFLLPNEGAGGTFAGGTHSLTVLTDNQGRAIARGFRPNQLQGQYQIHVNTSFNGQTASANITQTNALGAAGASAGTAAAAGVSGKLVAALVAVGAATIAGTAWYVTHQNNNNSAATLASGTSTISIAAGSGLIGPPK